MRFDKMHGAGNDFCLFNDMKQQLHDLGTLAQAVCDRHFGVGGDGIMVCRSSSIADIKMLYYNSDGSPGAMCGNGIRCFSKYVYTHGLVRKKEFTVETNAGIKTILLTLTDSDEVQSITVGMGKPAFEPEHIPTTLPGTPVNARNLDVDGQQITLTALRMSVPHCVVFVNDLEAVDVNTLGRKIENHPAFPERTNVNFVQVTDRKHMRIRTWERGAGRTLACGTGCCSSAVAARLSGLVDDTVSLHADGGVLHIHVDEDYQVTMTGGAEFICSGDFSDWVVRRANMDSIAQG